MFEDKILLTIIAVTVLTFGAMIFLAFNMGRTVEVGANPNVTVKADVRSYDWGKIGINDGDVEKTFEIKNDGSEILKLSKVVTSCACTTAQLILGEQKSPTFGMHTRSSYIMEVPPGETAQLKVIFIPDFHGPNGVGIVSRNVVVATNDPNNQELNFLLNALVTK
jgi:hypothetical protein